MTLFRRRRPVAVPLADVPATTLLRLAYVDVARRAGRATTTRGRQSLARQISALTYYYALTIAEGEQEVRL